MTTNRGLSIELKIPPGIADTYLAHIESADQTMNQESAAMRIFLSLGAFVKAINTQRLT